MPGFWCMKGIDREEEGKGKGHEMGTKDGKGRWGKGKRQE